MIGTAVVILPVGRYPSRNEVKEVEQRLPRYLIDVEMHPQMLRYCITARRNVVRN
jgi:hypothetical protein